MIGVSEKILNYASGLQQFSVDDIPTDVLSGLERAKLSWYLGKLCRTGKLRRVGRGVYTLQSANTFMVKANAKARSLYRSLSGQYPFADFCIYSANVITPLLHDLMPNNTLYVETNRDTIQSVFDTLLPKYNGRIFLAPTKEIATTYIDFSKENIIVKPLITEAPLALDGKVPVPTLEKLLVDTRVDDDFYYLHGYENLEMLRTAIGHYDVNQTRLLRYADRRNAKDSIQKDLETIKNNDTERML
jgi:predicted transcriptional regulator of viral defense system